MGPVHLPPTGQLWTTATDHLMDHPGVQSVFDRRCGSSPIERRESRQILRDWPPESVGRRLIYSPVDPNGACGIRPPNRHVHADLLTSKSATPRRPFVAMPAGKQDPSGESREVCLPPFIASGPVPHRAAHCPCSGTPATHRDTTMSLHGDISAESPYL